MPRNTDRKVRPSAEEARQARDRAVAAERRLVEMERRVDSANRKSRYDGASDGCGREWQRPLRDGGPGGGSGAGHW